jgi:hypothetical protein
MITKYYTLGELNDSFGTGLTLACYSQDDNGEWIGVMRTTDGSVFLGYKPTEISETEYITLQQQIASPDMITYFPGKFPRVGVVNKATYTKLQKEQTKLQKAYDKEQLKLSTEQTEKEAALCAKLGVNSDELKLLAKIALAT